MIRPKHVLGAGVLLLASVAAHAEDTLTTYVFDSITAIRHARSAGITITGVLANDTVPTSLSTDSAIGDGVGAQCAKYYELMLLHPGTYALSLVIKTTSDGFPPPPVPYSYLFTCSIAVKP
jgi:hypothetical protein